MKLIVGLGNPGREYAKTRHNVGFIILDNYLGKQKWTKDTDSYIYSTVINNQKVLFLKPLTYMNLSGNSVKRIVDYYKINIDDILVIQDDLDLSEGDFKLKKDSSSGGHNGIKSIIKSLGTDAFLRLKIGVGNNKEIDTKDYVLGKLSKSSIASLDANIYKEIIDGFISSDSMTTISLFNSKRK